VPGEQVEAALKATEARHYLDRVPKVRILEAVSEAKDQQSAQLGLSMTSMT
jgi:hypothetical protein